MIFKLTAFAFSMILTIQAFSFSQVVIWGHKLHSHTHSYIHEAFYRAFKALNYKVYYLDKTDDISNIDFSNSLFLTEGQVDTGIPLREDCFYILHNTAWEKYENLHKKRKTLTMQVYTNDVRKLNFVKEIKPYIFVSDTYQKNRTVWMPWATDLLPQEIEVQKTHTRKRWKDRFKEPYIAWVGTIGDGEFGNKSELKPFLDNNSNAKFIQKTGLNLSKHIDFISQAYIAPTIVGEWQKKQGYIPCRIFKNISYGQPGITNSFEVYEIMGKKVLYNPNTTSLLKKSFNYINNYSLQDQLDLMDFIKENHTYISRVQLLLSLIKKIQEDSD